MQLHKVFRAVKVKAPGTPQPETLVSLVQIHV